MKQLAEQVDWKASKLRRRIGELEQKLDNAPAMPKVYLRRRDLKHGFNLMIGHDREHCHTIRDAGEMAEAGAAQAKRLQTKELETARVNLALLEQLLDEYRDDDIMSLLEQIPKAYRELPWNPTCGEYGRPAPGGAQTSAGQPGNVELETREMLLYPDCIAEEVHLEDRDWVSANTERNPYQPERRKIGTSFGLMVRSKSEMLIAEQLWQAGLSFRYEPEIFLRDSGNVEKWYPDFEIRLSRDRVVFWEHLGLMDNDDYVRRSKLKIRRAFDNGIWPGNDLILTLEDEARPLDINRVLAQVEMLRFLARKGSNNGNNGFGSANYKLYAS